MLFRLIITSVAVASYCYANISSGDSNNHPDVSDALIEWLRANGAYINEKLEVKHVVPDDPSSPRGVFAIEDMDAGETLCSIPSKLVVKARKEHMEGLPPDYEDCGVIKAVMEAMSGDDINPYGQYLLHQPKGYLPTFWSEAGTDLLEEMLESTRSEQLTEYDELPPHGVQTYVGDLKRDCNGDVDDPFYLQAAMLVNARADYKYMIPIYDMFNHHNGKYNMAHKFDYYTGKDQNFENRGAEFITTKSIKAGDELYNSYNRCTICHEYYDWHGTPEMFAQFGFVETLPQRWLFDFARVKFDLDWKDGDETTGEMVVDFLVPPSEKGMLLLQEELTRLKSFSTMHRSKSYKNYDGMSKYEWESLWQYYDALHDALSNAIAQSNATLSDEIWELDDNWWVKDGPLTASQVEEHPVLPTQNNGILNDEL